MGLKKYLSQFDEPFENAEVIETPRGRLDEGEYHVVVTNFQPRMSQTGKPMFVAELEVIEGKWKGRKLNKYMLYDTPKTLGETKLDLMRCGLRLEKFSDLADRMGDMFMKELIVSVKHQRNDEKRVNVYIESEYKPDTNPFADDKLPF